MFIKTNTLKISKESPNTNMYVFIIENSKEEVSKLQKKFTDNGNFILIMDVNFNIIEIGEKFNFYTKIISKKTNVKNDVKTPKAKTNILRKKASIFFANGLFSLSNSE